MSHAFKRSTGYLASIKGGQRQLSTQTCTSRLAGLDGCADDLNLLGRDGRNGGDDGDRRSVSESSDRGGLAAGSVVLGPEVLVRLDGGDLARDGHVAGGVGGNSLDTVEAVEVLVKSDLEHGRRSLAGDNGRVGKEVGPDPVPPGAVLCGNDVLVRQPVLVPPVNSRAVVNAKNVDRLDLESGTLKLVDDPAEIEGRVGSGEDVLVHEDTPDEVLELPLLAETCDLEDEKTVIGKKLVQLVEESAVAADTNVLGHLETRDLVEAALGLGNVTVVHAEDAALRLGDTVLAETLGSKLGTALCEGDCRELRTGTTTHHRLRQRRSSWQREQQEFPIHNQCRASCRRAGG